MNYSPISKKMFDQSVGAPAILVLFCFMGILAFDVFGENSAPPEAKALVKTFSPGDAIKVSAFPDTTPFVNTVYSIDGNGFVDLPLVGKTQVAGMSEDELRAVLDSAYVKFLRFSSIRVQPLMRISFLGGFARPGLYYVNPDQPFWNAVSTAGGTIREDGIAKMIWERGRAVVSKDLVPAFESGASMASMGFQSGDRIRVTPRPRLTGWDIFRGDVLPLVTFGLTTVSTAATLYITYKTYESRSSR